jgi:hypothetical protein
LLFASCSDNPVTPPNTGNQPVAQDSLIGSFDSLCVFANPVNTAYDFKYLAADSITKFKVTFDGVTNLTDTSGILSFEIGGGLYLWFMRQPSQISKSWSVSDSTSLPFSLVKFQIWIQSNPDPTKYIKFKNVKLYKRN